MNSIYFDIETFGRKPDIWDFAVRKEDIKVPGQYKKQESIEQYIEEKYARRTNDIPKLFDEAWRKNALNILKCEVICFGIKINNEKAFAITGNNEYELLSEVQRVFSDFHYGSFMTFGWNTYEFDVPILNLLSSKYDLRLLNKILPKDRRGLFHVDLMRAMNPTVYNYYCKLNDACKFFDIQGKMEGMDGSMVHDLYINGEIEKIKEYCCQDIDPLAIIKEKLMINEPVTAKMV